MSGTIRFTRDDAQMVRGLVHIADVSVTREDTLALWREARLRALDLADRIEKALLPSDTGDGKNERQQSKAPAGNSDGAGPVCYLCWNAIYLPPGALDA